MACAPEELAAGAKRLVIFDRKVVCAWCAGIRGIRPHCPHCGGAGIRTERDVVEVVVRPGTPPGATLKFADMGNEDINGVRGRLRCGSPRGLLSIGRDRLLMICSYRSGVPDVTVA